MTESSSSPTLAEQAVSQQFNTIRGRVCGLLESFGLPEKQERAAITTFKSLTYDAEAAVKDLVD